MEKNKDILGMLDLMIRPGFCVKDQRICKVNQAAQSLCLVAGMEILPCLYTGKEEYQSFREGTLYLNLELAGQIWGASVTRVEDMDVFLLEQELDNQELQAMALAAKELRTPLSNVMLTAQRLFPLSCRDEDPQTREQVARLNRGLYQMLRVLGNMSDAARTESREQRMLELGSLFREIFEKSAAVIAATGVQLRYQGPAEEIMGLANGDQLERAVLNMLSNALKFSTKGSNIVAQLTRRGHILRLSIRNEGQGIPEEIRRNAFTRYLRRPALEDSHFGLGLGMVLIRAAASDHGGVVLLDQPEPHVARVTMTMDLRRRPDGVRSQLLHVDYAGEWDHWLVELADSLPWELYDRE